MAMSFWGFEQFCYGLNCVPPEIHMLESQAPVPQNVTLFGERAIKEVTELKWGY